MSRGSIRLSPKHGLNPSLALCWFCSEPNGEIIIPGMLKGDKEAPRRAVWNMDPCAKCKALQAEGVFLFEAREGKRGEPPERTGRMCVVKDDAIRRMFQPAELVADVLAKRVAFVSPEGWDAMGLPKESAHDAA